MRPIIQHLPCSTMDHIYTQTTNRDSRDEQRFTGCGGHLTKHSPCRPVGREQQLYIMPEAIHHPDRSILRQPLWDLQQPPSLGTIPGDRDSYTYSKLYPSNKLDTLCTGQKCQQINLHQTGITLVDVNLLARADRSQDGVTYPWNFAIKLKVKSEYLCSLWHTWKDIGFFGKEITVSK